METDIEKALTLLVHDLRAPLSVAQGYVRLLKDNRLPSPAERERALAQTMDALGRMTTLCEDASAFSTGSESDGAATVTEPVRTFTERVQRNCTARGADTLAFDVEDRALIGVVRGHRIDRIAEAVATVLCAAQRAPRDQPARVAVAAGEDEIQFLFGAVDDRSSLASAPPAEFDPWRGGHGLALPLACRTIRQAGGRVWIAPAVRGAVAVALPQE